MSDVTVIVKTRGADVAAKEIKGVGDAAEKAGGPLSKLGSGLADVGKIAGGFVLGAGIIKAPGFLMDAAKAAAEDAAATTRLNTALENYLKAQLAADGVAVDSADALGDLADGMAELTQDMNERIEAGQKLAFTDDQVRDSMQFLLAATGDYGEATKRSTAAMDLARGAGIDLSLATKMLGKLNEENVEVFKKLGITLGENATEAEALAAVQAKFGGQAEAYAKSTAGQFEQTKIRMGELKEQIGTALLPAMASIGAALVNDVIPKLEQFAGFWANSVQPKVEAFITFLKTVVMPEVQLQFAKFQDYYESDIKPAIDNIKTAIASVVSFLKEHWGQIEPFVRPLLIAVETAFKVMVSAIGVLIDLLGGDWEGAWEGMKQIASDILDGILGIADAFKDQIVTVFTGMKNAVMDIDWWDLGAQIIRWAARGLRDMAGEIIGAAGDIANGIKEKLNPSNWIGSPKGIQNWYAHYYRIGMANLRQEAESNADFQRTVELLHGGLNTDKLAVVGGKSWNVIPDGSLQGFDPDGPSFGGSADGSGAGWVSAYIGGGQYGYRPYTEPSIDKYGSSYQGGPGLNFNDPSASNYFKDTPNTGNPITVNIYASGYVQDVGALADDIDRELRRRVA